MHGSRWGRIDLSAVPPCMRQGHHCGVKIVDLRGDVKWYCANCGKCVNRHQISPREESSL